MKSKHLLLLMLLAFCAPWAANAQSATYFRKATSASDLDGTKRVILVNPNDNMVALNSTSTTGMIGGIAMGSFTLQNGKIYANDLPTNTAFLTIESSGASNTTKALKNQNNKYLKGSVDRNLPPYNQVTLPRLQWVDDVTSDWTIASYNRLDLVSSESVIDGYYLSKTVTDFNLVQEFLWNEQVGQAVPHIELVANGTNVYYVGYEDDFDEMLFSSSTNYQPTSAPNNTGTASSILLYVEESISCVAPTDLSATVENTSSGLRARLQWTPASGQNAWRLYYINTSASALPSHGPGGGIPTASYVDLTSSDVIYTGQVGVDGPVQYLLTGLAEDSDYQFWVHGNCSGDLSESSEIFEFSTSTGCEAPTRLTAGAIGLNGATVRWKANSGETSWTLYYMKEGAASTFTEVSVSGTPVNGYYFYPLSNLQSATTYMVVVRADCSADSHSAYSSTLTFTTLCPEPENLSVSNVSETEATLTWTADAPATWDYSVTKVADGQTQEQGTVQNSSNATVSLDNLEANTLYVCEVGSECNSSTTGYFLTRSSCTAPASVTASNIGSTSATLSWTNTGAQSYTLTYVKQNGGTEQTETVLGNSSNFDITKNLSGLDPSSIYIYTVVANCGEGSTSNPVSGFFETACPAVSGLTITTTSTTATVSWTENGSATSWYISTGNGTITEVTTNPYTLTGLTPDTQYTVAVSANCGSGITSDAVSSLFTTAASVPCITTYYQKVTSTSEINSSGSYILVYEGSSGGASPMVALTSMSNSGNVAMGTASMSNGVVTAWPINAAVLKVSGSNGRYMLSYMDLAQNKTMFLYGETGTGKTSWAQQTTMWNATQSNGGVVFLINGWFQQYASSSLLLQNKMETNVYLYKLGESVVAPTNLAVVEGSVTSESAELQWVNNCDDASSWRIMVMTGDAASGGVTTSYVTAGSNPFVLDNLEPETTYTVQVCTNYNGSYSDWSNTVTFTTPASCMTYSYRKVTSTSDVSAGDYFILVNENTDRVVLEGSYPVYISGTSVTIDNNTISTLPTGTAVLQISGSDPYAFMGSKYLNAQIGGGEAKVYMGPLNTSDSYWKMEYASTTDFPNIGVVLKKDVTTGSGSSSDTYYLNANITTGELNLLENPSPLYAVVLYKRIGTLGAPTVTYTDLTSSSVKLEWNDCDADQWEIVYDESPYTPTAATTATATSTDPSVELTGLTPATTYDAWVRTKVGSTTSDWSKVTFTTLSIQNIFTPNDGNNWNVIANWSLNQLPSSSENVLINGDCIIPSGAVAEANNITIGTSAGSGLAYSLTIAEGGQLKYNNQAENAIVGTLEKNITPSPTSSSNTLKWYTISSPFTHNLGIGNVSATMDYALTNDQADLAGVYAFDQSEEKEWRYLSTLNDQLVCGRGYLYSSNSINVGSTSLDYNVKMNGYLRPSNEPFEYNLEYSTLNEFTAFHGWNFVGNPFPCNAYIDMSYYRMVTNDSGAQGFDLDPESSLHGVGGESDAISPCEAVFVCANATGQKVVFSSTAPDPSDAPRGILNVFVEKRATRGTARVDKAIVSFREGDALPKLVLNPNKSKLYIPQNGKDYAIAVAEPMGVLPVNFEAYEDGNYTLSVTPEEAEFSYLHLIDNLTGTDVDLLALRQAQGPASYSFEASTMDYPSRFKLVFSKSEASEDLATDEPFAFYDGSEWVLATDGNATVQLVDVMGRVIVNTNGAHTISTNGMAAGVYVLRLINGNDVRTQKIVVK